MGKYDWQALVLTPAVGGSCVGVHSKTEVLSVIQLRT